jgi:hypothetical protein
VTGRFSAPRHGASKRRVAAGANYQWAVARNTSMPLRIAGVDKPAGLREPTMFRPSPGDDTKLRRDETVFRTGEDIRKPALDTN